MSKEIRLVETEPKEFCFQLSEGGPVHRLPSIGSLPVKAARRLIGIDEGDTAQMLDVLSQMMDDVCPGLTDSLTLEQFVSVTEAWMAADGIRLGE